MPRWIFFKESLQHSLGLPIQRGCHSTSLGQSHRFLVLVHFIVVKDKKEVGIQPWDRNRAPGGRGRGIRQSSVWFSLMHITTYAVHHIVHHTALTG